MADTAPPEKPLPAYDWLVVTLYGDAACQDRMNKLASEWQFRFATALPASGGTTLFFRKVRPATEAADG